MVTNYKVRQQAKQDIKKIGRYTLKKYGKRQRDKYLGGLSIAFESLSEMPYRGQPRDDIRKDYYSYQYEKHVIFYRIHARYVEIIAVLHNRMLPENYLDMP